MKTYSNYSLSALKLEADNIKKLVSLVRNMDKPSNFTYIDVLNLHNALETLYNELRETIKEKEN